MLRNRALEASNGKQQRPGIFDDRFELESRGRANATGLSGTSDPDNDERNDADITGDGIVDGLDDSGYQQTNYYNNNMNDTHGGGGTIINYDNGHDDRSQILHTQPFEDSII